ncbi:MFS transporter [Methanohalobium sp.]|uniref:MFS transporter n=1 Tax=Methanohalobium sp. TaxID=2837493 RepID=UPI0025E732E8|nr:MFS transporter [Methanohalobium sp.]
MTASIPTFSRKRQMFLLSIGTFCVFLGILSLIPLLPDISEDLNISKSHLGWVAGTFLIFMALLQVPFGLISDRFGRKVLIFSGIFIFGTGVGILSLASNFITLLFARAVSGTGAAIFFQTSFTMVGDMFKYQERGRAMSVLAVATGFGTISGYSVGGIFGGIYGWREVFMALAGIAFFVSFLSLFMRETRVEITERKTTSNVLQFSFDMFRKRTIVFITLIAMLCDMAAIGASYVVPFFAKDAGITTAITGLIFIPHAAVSSLGASFSGWVSDIVGRKKPLVIIAILGGCALFLLSQIPPISSIIAFNFAFVGLCFGPVVTLTSTLLVDEVVKVDSSIIATTMGTFNMVRWLGSAAGPVMAGIFLEFYGTRIAFILLSVTVFVSVLLSVGIKEKKEYY